MADEEAKFLLNKWNLSQLIEKFEENMIDVAAMRLLTEVDIDNLIQIIGLKVRFRENWKIWLNNLNAAQAQENNSEASYDVEDLPVLLNITNALNSDVDNQTDQNYHNNILNFFPGSNEQPLNCQFATTENHQKKINKAPFSEGIAQDDFVYNILYESIEGRAILLSGKQTDGLLTEAQRKEIGRRIIRYILKDNPSLKIQSVTFTRLSLQIVKLFPKEQASLYFTSSLAANKYQKKKNASGILYEAYISRRRKLRSIGELPRGSSRSSSSSSISSKSEKENLVNLVEENPILNEHLQWLTNNIEPWSVVELYWKATQEIRDISSEKGSILEYFNKFPALKQPQGYQLLLNDFCRLYPDLENSLLSNIVLKRESLVKIANERIKTSKDKEYKHQLREYISAASDDSNKYNLVATLLLIPYVLTVPPASKKIGKPVWKPSRSEIRDGFITIVATESEILPVIEARKNKYTRLSRTFQPLIVLVGTLTEISSSIVVINDIFYYFSSPIAAVDGAFKIFHSTGAHYQEEAQDVWIFIQRAFYSIKTKYDRISQAIRHLMTDLSLQIDD